MNKFFYFSEIGFGHLSRILFLSENLENKIFFSKKYYNYLKSNNYKVIKINLVEKLGIKENLMESNNKTVIRNLKLFLIKEIKRYNFKRECIFVNDSSILVGNYLRKFLNCKRNIFITNHFNILEHYYLFPREKRRKFRYQLKYLKFEFEKLEKYYDIYVLSFFKTKYKKLYPPYPKYDFKKIYDIAIYLPKKIEKIYLPLCKKYKCTFFDKFDRYYFAKKLAKSKLIISLAGFNTIFQAIINKTIPYVIPIKNHIEQEFNYYFVKKYFNDDIENLLKNYNYYIDVMNNLINKFYSKTEKIKWQD